MLCMSSAGIPENVFMAELPTSRSAVANGTIHLTHSSTSTLFRAARTEGWHNKDYVKWLERRNLSSENRRSSWFFFYLRHFPPAPGTRSETGLKQQERHLKTQGIVYQASTSPTAREDMNKKNKDELRLASKNCIVYSKLLLTGCRVIKQEIFLAQDKHSPFPLCSSRLFFRWSHDWSYCQFMLKKSHSHWGNPRKSGLVFMKLIPLGCIKDRQCLWKRRITFFFSMNWSLLPKLDNS